MIVVGNVPCNEKCLPQNLTVKHCDEERRNVKELEENQNSSKSNSKTKNEEMSLVGKDFVDNEKDIYRTNKVPEIILEKGQVSFFFFFFLNLIVI